MFGIPIKIYWKLLLKEYVYELILVSVDGFHSQSEYFGKYLFIIYLDH